MIYFRNLTAEGAFSFSKISLPLANQGLTLITGSNLDDFEGTREGGSAPLASANGAGKSSLLEILTHNIYANTGKGVRKNQIVNTFYPEGYMSQLDLTLGDTPYSYIQSRSHKTLGTVNQIHKDSKDLAIKGLEETQKSFQQLVKLSLEDWYSTVYLSQQARHLFTRTDSNDLKKDMLARIFNLNYKAYLESTKKKLEETRTALLQLKSSIASTKAQILSQLESLPYHTDLEFTTHRGAISDCLSGVKKNLLEKTQTLQAYQQAKIAQATKDNYQKQIQDQLVQLGSWTGGIPAYSDIQNTIQGVQGTIQTIKKQVTDISSYLQVLKQRDSAFQELENWKATPEYASLAQLSQLEIQVQDTYFKYSQLTTSYNEDYFLKLTKLRELDFTVIKTLKDEVESLSKQLQDAQSNSKELSIHYEAAKGDWLKVQTGICYACERPFPPEKVEALKNLLQDKELAYKESVEKVQALQTAYNQKNLEYGNLQKYFNDLENLKMRLISPDHLTWSKEDFLSKKSELETSYSSQTKFLETVRKCKVVSDRYDSFSAIQGDYKTYEKALEDYRKAEEENSAYLLSMTSISTLIYQYEGIVISPLPPIDESQMGAEIRHLTSKSEELADQLSVLNRDYQYFTDYSNQLTKILQNETQIDTLEKREQIYGSLTYAFGSKGLVVSRLEIICKYLTEKVNYYISRIMKEDIQLQFVMDEDSLDLRITFNGKERGVANLSGGESSKVGLACMLGLRSLLPIEYQTNILVLDEAEANWDDRVRQELVEMLEFLLTSTNLDSIFMISHSSILQSLQTWNTHIHCVKEKGITTLEISSR